MKILFVLLFAVQRAILFRMKCFFSRCVPVSRKKGFFLLFELVIALLLFLSFYAAAQSHFSASSFSLPSRVAEVGCYDLLSLWVSGEEDVSSLARAWLPDASFSLSSTPIYSSREQSFACHALRFQRGVEESLYILIEW